MHDAIASWASKEMYNGSLQSSPTVSSHLLVDSPFVRATWITQCPLLCSIHGCLMAACMLVVKSIWTQLALAPYTMKVPDGESTVGAVS